MPLRTLADLRSAVPPEWVWDGYLSPGSVTLLSAQAKTGKTTLLAHLLRAMWTEDEFLGQGIRPTPTMILSEEADTMIAGRADSLGYSDMWPIFWQTLEPEHTWEGDMARIKRFTEDWSTPLIVVDTLSRHWGIDDENDNAKVEKILTPLLAVIRKSHAILLLIHHLRKSGGRGGTASRGAGALIGAVDIIMELSRYGKEEQGTRRNLESFSRFAETPDKLTIELGEDGYRALTQDSTEEKTESGWETKAWLVNNPGWWTADSIAAASKQPLRTARGALAQLVGQGTAYQKGTGRKNDPYQYAIGLELMAEEDDDD